jgi:argininosuccinate synthase
MSNKQTAVEWFFRWLEDNQESTIKEYVKAFEQAKAIEKKQIEIAFSDGQKISINSQTLPMYSREEYYNDTYND